MSVARRQRGIALVLVLWLVVLLTVIGGSHAYNAHVETRVTMNQVDSVRARALAEAGVNRGIMELYAPDKHNQWRFDGSDYLLRLDDGEPVTVALRNAAGRVDLNRASQELLKTLLGALGMESERGNALSDAILDWRDDDHLTRLNGAEDRDYRAAGLDYEARDTPFLRVDELRYVLGMDDSTYRRLEPHLSVHGENRVVNPRHASRELLGYLTGAENEDLDTYLARRAESESDPGLGVWPSGAGFLGDSQSKVFYILARARGPAGSVARLEAVVKMTESPFPYRILAWRNKPFEPDSGDG